MRPLLAALGDPDQSVRSQAAGALQGFLPDPRVADTLERAWRQEGNPALPPDAMQDETRGLRAVAAWVAGVARDKGAVEPLAAFLRDREADEGARLRAIEALGRIADPRAVEPLAAAVAALGAIPGDTSVAAVIGALRDEFGQVRVAAIRALAALGAARDPRVVPELARTALAGGEPATRAAAVEALAGISDPRAFDILSEGLRSANMDTKLNAVRALMKSAETRAAPLLAEVAVHEADQGVRSSALEALKGHPAGASAVEPLLAVLRDKNQETRGRAVAALASLRAAASVVPLIAALEDPDPGVRESAAQALGKIGDRRATEPLIGRLRGTARRGCETTRRWPSGSLGTRARSSP